MHNVRVLKPDYASAIPALELLTVRELESFLAGSRDQAWDNSWVQTFG